MEPPRCFISYSWDSDQHKEWVRHFATRLRECGVDAILDQWHCAPGIDLTIFMEKSVRESKYVVLVCTPTFCKKADSGVGGVGYEKAIVTGEIFAGEVQDKKFVPVLREGDAKESLPSYLKSRLFIDFRDDKVFEDRLEELLRHFHGAPLYQPPPIGPKPDFQKSKASKPGKTKKNKQLEISKKLHPSELTTPENRKGQLWIDTKPPSAKIKILKPRIRFVQGKQLKPGKYQLEVSANTYTTKRKWIELAAGEKKHISMTLTKEKALPTKSAELTREIDTKGKIHTPPRFLANKGTFLGGPFDFAYDKDQLESKTYAFVQSKKNSMEKINKVASECEALLQREIVDPDDLLDIMEKRANAFEEELKLLMEEM